ncbi:MAG TPA: hypothetical protein PLU36_09435 [Chitinophagaceae bacterium]|nr:hypothetical protein [Chitinophagaceae bacterium]HMZ47012.1 hypothetical protein [Chitinophagaceae bacterium]HNE94184.1 hypothetical protein [Chitinophagaceae bacterium]HNF28911.1 hypothetical protein [Chitinophagaceae bacterium]HNM33769.1 hypothetical protein [Chitinophagaceae bacterium]
MLNVEDDVVLDPYHYNEIATISNKFLTGMGCCSINDVAPLLTFILSTDYKKEFSKQEVIIKLKSFFEQRIGFQNFSHTIENIDFDINEGMDGYGLADGIVNYNTTLDSAIINSENIHFKLFFIYEEKNWKIFFFKFPEFIW